MDAANITDFDQIQSTGITIEGYAFTGDQVILLLDSAQVDEFGELTGVNTDGASAGIFFGPVDFNGNPEEFGADAVVGGDVSYVYGLAAGGNPAPAE